VNGALAVTRCRFPSCVIDAAECPVNHVGFDIPSRFATINLHCLACVVNMARSPRPAFPGAYLQ